MTATNDETAVLPVTPSPDPPGGDDGLARELAKAAPRRWWTRTTVGLAGAVLLVGGFAGGLQAQQSWGPQQPGNARGFNGAAGGGFGSGGGQGRAGAGFTGGGFQRGTPQGSTGGGGTTTGTVKLVDGSTIYVQTADGDVVTVKTDGKTSVSAASKSELSAVKPGQSVTVQGTAAQDGSVTATSVTAQRK